MSVREGTCIRRRTTGVVAFQWGSAGAKNDTGGAYRCLGRRTCSGRRGRRFCPDPTGRRSERNTKTPQRALVSFCLARNTRQQSGDTQAEDVDADSGSVCSHPWLRRVRRRVTGPASEKQPTGCTDEGLRSYNAATHSSHVSIVLPSPAASSSPASSTTCPPRPRKTMPPTRPRPPLRKRKRRLSPHWHAQARWLPLPPRYRTRAPIAHGWSFGVSVWETACASLRQCSAFVSSAARPRPSTTATSTTMLPKLSAPSSARRTSARAIPSLTTRTCRPSALEADTSLSVGAPVLSAFGSEGERNALPRLSIAARSGCSIPLPHDGRRTSFTGCGTRAKPVCGAGGLADPYPSVVC